MSVTHGINRIVPAVLLSGLLIATSSLSAQETILVFPPDVSSFPEVSTWFFPFDSEGNFPEEIVASDFQLLEDGVLVVPDFIECPEGSDPVPVAATIAVDVSGSMGTRVLDRTILSIVTDAVGTFVRKLDMSSSTASLLTFNTISRVLIPFTNDTTRILTELDRLLHGQGTDFREAFLGPAGAIPIARTGEQKRIIVMFTDGEGVTGDADEIIRRAREAGVAIYIVVVGAYPWEMLERIALETGGLYFHPYREPEQIDKLARLILDHARRESPCRVVWQGRMACNRNRKVLIRLGQPALWGETGYQVPDVPMPDLLPERDGVLFGILPQGSDTTVAVELTALRGAVTLEEISGTGANVSVVELDEDPGFLPRTILPGTPLSITLRYRGSGEGVDERIVLRSSTCDADTIYCTAGSPIERGPIPSIRIVGPNGGEVFPVGSVGMISFTGGNPTVPYILDYTIDGGDSWIPAGESLTPSPLQVLFADRSSDSCLARVRQMLRVDESTLFADRSEVIDLEFTHDGRELVTLGADRVVRRRLVPTGALLGETPISVPAERILPIAGTSSVAVEHDGSLWVYSTASSNYEFFPGYRFADPAFPSPLPVSNRDRRIVSHPEEPVIYGVSFRPGIGGAPVGALYRRNVEIDDYLEIDSLDCLPRSIAITDDGRFLAVGGVGGCLEVRRNGFREVQFRGTFTRGDIVELAFDPSGLYLAVLFEDQARGAFDIVILRTTDGMEVDALTEVSNRVRTIDFLSTVDTLLVGELRPTVRSTWDGSIHRRLDRGEPGPYGAARSPSSPYIATTTGTDGSQLWELQVPYVLTDLSDSLWRLVPSDARMQDVDFGRRLVGSHSDSTVRSLITNRSLVPVLIDSLRITGPERGDYSLRTPVRNLQLPPAGSVDVELTFEPGGEGDRNASLEFGTGGTMVTAALTGVGAFPSISVIGLDGQSLDFGSLPLGDRRDSVVLVRNTGDLAVMLDSISVDGPNGAEFIVDQAGLPRRLDPLAETTLDVRFVPTRTGLRTTGCGIWYSDSEQGGPGGTAPVLFTLSGIGIASEGPDVGITDSLIRLSSTCLKPDSVPVTIVNLGSADVTVTAAIVQTGSAFEVDPTDLPLVIPPLESRSVTVRFSPDMTGLWSEKIGFVYGGTPGDTVSLMVEGSATEAPADLDVTLLAADTLFCEGGAIPFELAIRSRGETPQVVTAEVRFDVGSGVVSGPDGGLIAVPPGEEISTLFSIVPDDGADTVRGQLILSGLSCLDDVGLPFMAVRRRPVVSISAVDTICQGESVRLQVVGEGEVLWEDHPDIACADCPDQDIRPTASGWYRMEFTDMAGCRTVDSVEVVVVEPSRGNLSFTPVLAAAVNDTVSIPIVYRHVSGEGIVTDELSISVRYDPGVLLPSVEDEEIFVGTPLVGWRVERLERTFGEVTWHLRGDPVLLDDDLLLMRLVGRVFIGGSRGTDLHAAIRMPGSCFGIEPAEWWLDVDSICGLDDRLIEIGFGRWDRLRVVPNPVRSGPISISFELPWDAEVDLEVLDLNGRTVVRLVDGPAQAGDHTEIWDATDVSAGQYFIRLRSGKLTSLLPVMLLE